MIHKTIEQIAAMIPIQNEISKWSSLEINGVSINSRTVENGNLFIPIKGENHDGHEYVEQAIKNGASASLWQADIPNPPANLPIFLVENTLEALQQLAHQYRKELPVKVVAVTGSNGKTTTKDMLAELLSIRYKVQKTIGNLNNHIGLPLTILGLKKDTEVAVLEMGMSGFGEIELLSTIANPDAALITNIGDAHLQELGSRAGIAQAKLEILCGLKKEGIFVYPGEEPLITSRLEKMNPSWKLKTFGKSNKSDIYPIKIEMGENQSVFVTNMADVTLRMPVLGEYNVMNALAAILVATEWDVPIEKMNQAFANLKLTNMRMELSDGINGSKILNDAYNASPTSMKAVLDLVASLQGYAQKIVVLGDMLELGPKEQEFHFEVGTSINHSKIDLVYTYGQLGKIIAEGAKEKFGESRVFAFDRKTDLIEHLKERIAPNTLILVKASRGMKLEEVVQAIKN